MTADQVSKGIPDDLLSSETCTIQPPLTVEPSVHEETGHALDQQAEPPPNISVTMLFPNLDNIAEIEATDIQEESGSGNVLDLVLVQPDVHTVFMPANRFNTTEEAAVNIANLDPTDVAQGGKDEKILTLVNQEVSKDEDITARSQPTANLHSDVSEDTTGNKATLEPVVPEKVTSQDGIVADCAFIGISTTDLPITPAHQDDETGLQNFDQNCLELSNQETKVLENSQTSDNRIPNKKDSKQTDDLSPSRHVNRGPSAVGDMPDTDFETGWVSKPLQDVMRVVDRVGQGETVCSTDLERGDVMHTDPEIRGIVRETVCNTYPEISGIAQETVCHIESEISDSTKEATFNPDPEAGDIVEEMFSCVSPGIPDIIHESTIEPTITNTVKDSSCEASNTAGETTHNTDSEIPIDNVIGETSSETVSNINADAFGETVCSLDSGTSGITTMTARKSDCEIPVIQETLYTLALELNKPDTVCAPPVPRHPSIQPSDNNLEGSDRLLNLDQATPNTNGMPGDSLADSAANLLGNVLTQTTSNLVTESELDMTVQGSGVLEDSLPDRSPAPMLHQLESMAYYGNDPVVDNMNENHTSIETAQISEEAEMSDPLLPDLCYTTQDLESSCKGKEEHCLEVMEEKYNNEFSNELWMDACQFLTTEEDRESIFDEWGHSPAPSPPRASLNNTRSLACSQGREAVISQLGDRELPPVESWSSSDSWASALSDWFQSVSVFTEDCPLTTITTSSSNLLDRPEPCMAIQDTIEEHGDSPESASTTGQMCLPPSPTEVRVDAQSGRAAQDDNANMHLHAQSYTARTQQDAPGGSVDTLKEIKMEVETVNPSGACMPNLGSHLQDGTVAPMTSLSQQISGIKPDGVQEVKEDGTFQLSLDFEEESIRNYRPSGFSGYPDDKDPTAGCACGPHLDIHVPQLDRPDHLEGVERDHFVRHADGSWSHVGFSTRDPESTQEESRPGEFIMPFAPISIGTSFHHSCEDQSSPKTSSRPSLIGITDEIRAHHVGCLPDNIAGAPTRGEEPSDDQFGTSFSACEEAEESQEAKNTSEASDISHELSRLILLTGQRFIVSEDKRVAYVTLDLDDALNFNKGSIDLRCDQREQSRVKPHNREEQLHIEDAEMPHKTHKTSSEGKTRSKHKEKMTGHQLGTPTKRQPEAHVGNESLASETGTVTVIETVVITEKVTPKSQGKKKKKHGAPKPESEPLAEVENGARPKATKAMSEGAEAKPTPTPGKVKEKPALPRISTISTDSPLKVSAVKCKETEAVKAGAASCCQESQSTSPSSVPDDDLIKRRRICGEKAEAVPIRTRPQLPAIFRQKKEEEVVFKRAYSDVVKQKVPTPKEVVPVPRVVAEIQAAPVPEDPQSISLWCQFSPVAVDTSITWTKEGNVLSETKRGVNDESRATLSIVKACSKDLGMYCCSLTSSLGSVSTSDYHLTSEVLMELVIPSHDTPAEPREVDGEEEDVQCAPLLFKEDILTDQYFGENRAASIVTEKAHFGEGMHRKAFRTTLRAGMVPVFNPGHLCVLKVHNAIGYGTKNNEELVEKNYNLAVEECHVQNTAREYIKAYMNAAKSAESFGEVPEIIPIYLVHRPSNNIPYATLEEELIGDFVKYSVKDGKEINLMRRDSEAGQKCCAFQHWVYSQTDGNLLVTDMQGVGMKLTDVGIATCRKGYKGFKGNCATSFIDQFKALHQCNRYCELLGLQSLQPKRTVTPAKPKTQPVPKKKTFGPVLKGKS